MASAAFKYVLQPAATTFAFPSVRFLFSGSGNPGKKERRERDWSCEGDEEGGPTPLPLPQLQVEHDIA